MVPRPRLNGELAHRHVVTCASSTGPGSAPLLIQQIAGSLQWVTGLTPASPNLSVSWSLAEMVIAIGGLTALRIAVPNVAELQQLYDMFQIEKVDITMSFGSQDSFVSNDINLGARHLIPLIGYSQDTDDAANTGITQLQQYSTYRMHQSDTQLKYSLVPCAAGTTFDPTAAGVPANLGFTRVQRQDINVAYAGTPHYGFKCAVDGMQANPNANFINTYVSIQSRIHFLMKNTR